MLSLWTEIPRFRFQPDRRENGAAALPITPGISPSLSPGPLSTGGLDRASSVNADIAGLIGSAWSQPNPFDLRGGRVATPLIVDRGLLLPRSAPLLFPDMAVSGLLGLGLRSPIGEPPNNVHTFGQDSTPGAPPF